ncbi:MAG: TatD family hydrolase [Acidobacteria bacterium]|nr:TatD family hydrolase [Acidobacteriota bacterium]
MIDSHCHLADEAFAADADAVVARAIDAGLAGALCIVDVGDPGEARRATALGARWSGLRLAAGVHPHRAGDWTGRVDAVAPAVETAIASWPGAVAVGEIGLDFHYDFSPHDVQREVFVAQVALARRLGRPVVLHAREADEEVLDLLETVGGGEVRGVFHCYTGTTRTAERLVAAGFHLGIGGIVTFPKGGNVREVVRAAPLERLLIETDSPYLAPVPYRGRRNEPAFVSRVADVVAEVRGVTRDEVIRVTTASFGALFGP